MIKTWLSKLTSKKDTESDVVEYQQSYLINQETIDQMIADTSLEVFPMLVDNFLGEAELRIANILDAIEQNDIATLEFEAHTLGSTALAMGATGLGLTARKMETACLNGTPKLALAQKDAFTAIAEQSKAAFSKVLAGLQQS